MKKSLCSCTFSAAMAFIFHAVMTVVRFFFRKYLFEIKGKSLEQMEKQVL